MNDSPASATKRGTTDRPVVGPNSVTTEEGERTRAVERAETMRKRVSNVRMAWEEEEEEEGLHLHLQVLHNPAHQP